MGDIDEETKLKIKVGRPFFECEAETNNVVLSEDHDDYKWIDPKDYKNFDLIPNLIPAFESYIELQG